MSGRQKKEQQQLRRIAAAAVAASEWRGICGEDDPVGEGRTKVLSYIRTVTELWGADKVAHYRWHTLGENYCMFLARAAKYIPRFDDARTKLNRLMMHRETASRKGIEPGEVNNIIQVDLRRMISWKGEGETVVKGRNGSTQAVLSFDEMGPEDIPEGSGLGFDTFGLLTKLGPNDPQDDSRVQAPAMEDGGRAVDTELLKNDEDGDDDENDNNDGDTDEDNDGDTNEDNNEDNDEDNNEDNNDEEAAIHGNLAGVRDDDGPANLGKQHDASAAETESVSTLPGDAGVRNNSALDSTPQGQNPGPGRYTGGDRGMQRRRTQEDEEDAPSGGEMHADSADGRAATMTPGSDECALTADTPWSSSVGSSSATTTTGVHTPTTYPPGADKDGSAEPAGVDTDLDEVDLLLTDGEDEEERVDLAVMAKQRPRSRGGKGREYGGAITSAAEEREQTLRSFYGNKDGATTKEEEATQFASGEDGPARDEENSPATANDDGDGAEDGTISAPPTDDGGSPCPRGVQVYGPPPVAAAAGSRTAKIRDVANPVAPGGGLECCCPDEVPRTLIRLLDDDDDGLFGPTDRAAAAQFGRLQSRLCRRHLERFNSALLATAMMGLATSSSQESLPAAAASSAAVKRRRSAVNLAGFPQPKKRQRLNGGGDGHHTPTMTATATATATAWDDHVPVHDPTAAASFVARVMHDIETKQPKLRPDSRGHRTNDVVLGVLRLMRPAASDAFPDPDTGAVDVHYWSGAQAAAAVERGDVDVPIVTAGQQRFRWEGDDSSSSSSSSPSSSSSSKGKARRPTAQMFDRMGDLSRNASVQVPSLVFGEASAAEKTLLACRRRFLAARPTTDPWNLLNLANPLPHSVLPAFLDGENCQLLARVRDEVLLRGGSGDRADVEATGSWGGDVWRDNMEWALMSEGGNNTAAHMDSHGFATWLTLQEGTMGFGWLSRPTEAERRAWMADAEGVGAPGARWRYVVLRAGETLFFDSGTAHVVFRPTGGVEAQTLTVGGHVLLWSHVRSWMALVVQQMRLPDSTNDEMHASAPVIVRAVERLVRARVQAGRAESVGGKDAVAEFERHAKDFWQEVRRAERREASRRKSGAAKRAKASRAAAKKGAGEPAARAGESAKGNVVVPAAPAATTGPAPESAAAAAAAPMAAATSGPPATSAAAASGPATTTSSTTTTTTTTTAPPAAAAATPQAGGRTPPEEGTRRSARLAGFVGGDWLDSLPLDGRGY